ncbi:chorismate--pyruvate lyase family protein [Leeia aquatica]|uniref:Probable chorismate pyruvate-lyase n=1 Tax=Leeia aquatica TaxID=2725557 RepID=A0A847SGC5_9NEIS|nr:chorismate lyase [Leeia aquatica]NLR76269.1 chorismate lyase [Leeia aquatica]
MHNPCLHAPDGDGWSQTLPRIDRVQQQWLSAPGSLTWRLRSLSSRFAVRHVVSTVGMPHADEFHAVGLLRRLRTLVRDVTLTLDGQPVVIGHSIAPLAAIRGSWQPVLHLGNRPLAEVLFTDPRVSRQALCYRQISARHPLHRQAERAVGQRCGTLWARRSVFLLRGAPLMVTEVFLPTLWERLHVEY